jgi:hypothetical protein
MGRDWTVEQGTTRVTTERNDREGLVEDAKSDDQ